MADKYPFTRFSYADQTPEKGGAVYAVWRCLGPNNSRILGYISKTRRGTWHIDISTRHYGQRITETKRFADAKQMARELLA